jgi:hypothetical protein
MESILSKVHVELANLAATYADARYENVMLSVISDFQHAICSILDKKILLSILNSLKSLETRWHNYSRMNIQQNLHGHTSTNWISRIYISLSYAVNSSTKQRSTSLLCAKNTWCARVTSQVLALRNISTYQVKNPGLRIRRKHWIQVIRREQFPSSIKQRKKSKRAVTGTLNRNGMQSLRLKLFSFLGKMTLVMIEAAHPARRANVMMTL